MGKRWGRFLFILLAILLILWFSQTAAFPDEPPPPLWSGQVGASYIQTKGNTDSLTVGAGFNVLWQKAPWKIELRGDTLRVESARAITARRSRASLKAEHTVYGRFSGYSQASYQQDFSADIRHQSIFDAGGVYHAIHKKSHELSISGAVAHTDESRFSSAPSRIFWGGRSGLEYNWTLRPGLQFSQTGDYLHDFSQASNWRASGSSTLTVQIVKILAIKISQQTSYTHAPAQGKRRQDSSLLISLAAIWPKTP